MIIPRENHVRIVVGAVRGFLKRPSMAGPVVDDRAKSVPAVRNVPVISPHVAASFVVHLLKRFLALRDLEVRRPGAPGL